MAHGILQHLVKRREDTGKLYLLRNWSLLCGVDHSIRDCFQVLGNQRIGRIRLLIFLES